MYVLALWALQLGSKKELVDLLFVRMYVMNFMRMSYFVLILSVLSAGGALWLLYYLKFFIRIFLHEFVKDTSSYRSFIFDQGISRREISCYICLNNRALAKQSHRIDLGHYWWDCPLFIIYRRIVFYMFLLYNQNSIRERERGFCNEYTESTHDWI